MYSSYHHHYEVLNATLQHSTEFYVKMSANIPAFAHDVSIEMCTVNQFLPPIIITCSNPVFHMTPLFTLDNYLKQAAAEGSVKKTRACKTATADYDCLRKTTHLRLQHILYTYNYIYTSWSSLIHIHAQHEMMPSTTRYSLLANSPQIT